MYRGGVVGRNARRAADAANQRRRAEVNIDFVEDAMQQQSEASANRKMAIDDRMLPGIDADVLLLAGLHHYDPVTRPQPLVDFMRTHDFRDNLPLGELFKVMLEKLPSSTLEEIQKSVYSDDWVKGPDFSRHSNDYPRWGAGSLFHPRYKLWYIMSLGQSQAWATAMASASGPAWNKLYQAINYLGHLSLLKRFVDDRNPETGFKPLPDGSNLQDADLRMSWVLHRQFLRTLHYRSLMFRNQPYGITELEQINYLSVASYYNELQSVPLEDQQRHVPVEFQFIWDFYDDLEQRLQNVANALFYENRPNPLQYPFQSTVKRNIDDPNKFESIIDLNLYYGNSSQEWQLWAHLNQITEDFDDRMELEHVEDVLIDRRIVIPDEEYEVAQTLANVGINYRRRDIDAMAGSSRTLDLVESRLRKIGQANRFRRNHLLLKDWNKKRPWRQLYYIYDTSDNGKPYRGYIAQFYAQGNFLESFPSRPFDGDSPSRTAGIFHGIYPIQPMASHGKEKPNVPQPHLRYFEDNCVICTGSFDKNQTIAQLFCDHLYHYACLRTFWDSERRYTLDCPQCRRNWKLDEVADITPEVFDVWDNARILGEGAARAEPNIDHLWLDKEYYFDLASRNWTTLGSNDDETPRRVWTEMVHLRKRRHRRNQMRRERYNVPEKGMQRYQANTLN